MKSKLIKKYDKNKNKKFIKNLWEILGYSFSELQRNYPPKISQNKAGYNKSKKLTNRPNLLGE